MAFCFIDHTCFVGHGSRCTLQLRVQSSKMSGPRLCLAWVTATKKKVAGNGSVASSSISVAVFIQAFIQDLDWVLEIVLAQKAQYLVLWSLTRGKMGKTVSGKPEHPFMTVKQKGFRQVAGIIRLHTILQTNTHTCAETICTHLGTVRLMKSYYFLK